LRRAGQGGLEKANDGGVRNTHSRLPHVPGDGCDCGCACACGCGIGIGLAVALAAAMPPAGQGQFRGGAKARFPAGGRSRPIPIGGGKVKQGKRIFRRRKSRILQNAPASALFGRDGSLRTVTFGTRPPIPWRWPWPWPWLRLRLWIGASMGARYSEGIGRGDGRGGRTDLPSAKAFGIRPKPAGWRLFEGRPRVDFWGGRRTASTLGHTPPKHRDDLVAMS
jgi:hypothetical protein